MRSPRRTARTASALMIGVALISAAALFTSSVRDTFGRILDRAVTADFIVLDPSFLGLSRPRWPRTSAPSTTSRRSRRCDRCWRRSTTTRSAWRRSTRPAFADLVDLDVTDGGFDGLTADDGVMLFRRQGRGSRRRRRRHGRRHVLERRRAPRSPSPASSTTTRSAATGASRPTCSSRCPTCPRAISSCWRASPTASTPTQAELAIEAGGRRVPAGRGADQRRVPRGPGGPDQPAAGGDLGAAWRSRS